MVHVSDLFSQKTGLLYDFNGTLSNDEKILEIAYNSALKGMGLPSLSCGEYEALLGRSEPDIVRSLLKERSAEQEYESLISALSKSYLLKARQATVITPATVRMLHTLKSQQAKQAIVTGTLRTLVTPLLHESGLDFLPALTVTIEDVEHGKPNPEGYLRGLELIGVEAKDALAFEDSPSGLKAAHSAGIEVIGIGPALRNADNCVRHFSTMDAVAQEFLGEA